MDKVKKIIIILTILIVTAIVVMVALTIFTNINEWAKDPDTGETIDSGSEELKENVVRAVIDRNTFFAVKDCVEKYYTVLESLWYDNSSAQVFAEKPTEGFQMSKYFAQYLYNILGENYIKENKITINNIGNTFTQKNQMETVVENMFSYDITEKSKAYFVKGYNLELRTAIKNDINIMVVVDVGNNCFAVYPSEYIQKLKLNEIEVGQKLDMNEKNFVLTKNENNEYSKKNIDVSTIIQEYTDLYKFNVNHDREAAYNSLNQEYRDKKFGSLEEYKNYLKNNLKSIEINKYATYKKEDYTQYVCTTSDNKYFIINEVAPMKYTIMLDAYTIDLHTFEDKYSTASETTKVAMNIEKIKMAVNDKDYKYVYNKLDETFKENNYPTLESLEKYLKNNLFEKNEFKCEDIEKRSNVYIFTIKVTPANAETTEEKNINIIMRLLEGTDFIMSFGQN